MPVDVAMVAIGLPVWIKLDAYDYSIYGSLKGKVSYISADTLTEETRRGEQIYYRILIQIDDDAITQQNAQYPDRPISIQAGMTGMIEINTGSKTVWHYLTKPIVKTLSESLTER